ncbi:MAG: hypothetical protein ACREKG_11815 [Candidatus Rokuibacteriota bacterium]
MAEGVLDHSSVSVLLVK